METGGVDPEGRVRYARTLRLAHGAAVLELVWDGADLTLRVDADLRDHADARRRAEHLVDAAAAPSAVDDQLAHDPELAPLVARTPGIRVPGVADPAEMVFRTLIGQQISLLAARRQGAVLTARLGSAGRPGWPGLERLFPTAEQFAAVDPTTLPMPRARGRALVGVAERLLDGRLVLNPEGDPAEARAQLLGCPGIGPWTADYVLMRVWHAADVLLTTDLIIARELAARPGLDPDAWSPYRSYGTLHLWHDFLQRSP